jgi:hypothetical protein
MGRALLGDADSIRIPPTMDVLVPATGAGRAIFVVATVTCVIRVATIERSSGVAPTTPVQRQTKEEDMHKLVELRRGPAILLAAASAFAVSAATAFAGQVVDPTTLQPVPPNAVCRADGPQVVCDTFVDETLVNEPVFDLPCGTVYETSSYHGAGTRWYVDGLLVKRHVASRLDGTWSLSPTGAGPTLDLSAHESSNSYWVVPGSGGDETATTTYHGSSFKVTAPGGGVLIQISGSTYPGGVHRGVLRGEPSPETATTLCAALAD